MLFIQYISYLTLYLFFIAFSNAVHFWSFFSLENIAWQQEEAPSGGPFMSEAIISEWTSAPPPAKHKHLTIERNMHTKLKNYST